MWATDSLADTNAQPRVDDLRASPDAAPDSTAFESVFRAHYQGLCDFVAGYVGAREIAHELVQDLFLRLWELQGTSEAPPLSRAYLYAAARNRAIKVLRRRRVEARWEQRAVRDTASFRQGPGSDEELWRSEIAHAAEGAIRELPERCRLVFTLSRHQHLSYAEIAQIMGISASTVETQMWRALKMLRAKLGPYLALAAAMESATVARLLL